MSQAVIIKSSKSGINLVLSPELSFPVLLEAILKKFKESEKFFGDASLAISFEGRELSDAEKCEIVDAIVTDTSVRIPCIIENDEIRDAIIQQKMQSQQSAAITERTVVASSASGKAPASFYYGSLAPGERLETDESIIIIGDVPAGASVVSKSDIVVLGALRGSAYAGMDGRINSFIAALEFFPEAHNIAGVYGESVPVHKVSIFSKRNKPPQAKIARARAGIINIRPLSFGLENYL
ncbi:MAG: septum site-determining protein MinC [Roseburia sp.]